MQHNYGETTIDRLLTELSSDAPTPGGGSVAALCGAMAASLVSMVCNLTIGKEKFAECEQEVKGILEEALKLRGRLLGAVEEDIQAYNSLVACYRLPKATPQEKEQRRGRIQAALKNATEVPYRTAEACYRVLELNRRLPQIGNPNAVSDVAVSAHLAEAAIQSALYNVDINCNYIKDDTYVHNYQKRRVALSQQAVTTKETVIEAVQAVLQA
jgi:formiminotetrahydrofolate cyclodeaminase